MGKHNVQCPDQTYLNNFALQTAGFLKMQYSYQCCWYTINSEEGSLSPGYSTIWFHIW
jgi:hypothetical protein